MPELSPQSVAELDRLEVELRGLREQIKAAPKRTLVVTGRRLDEIALALARIRAERDDA